MIGIVMFFVALLMLLFGFPVAFTFGGVALVFGVLAEGRRCLPLCHSAFRALWKMWF